jgi:uncharacterized protein YidB (DUF937 family)
MESSATCWAECSAATIHRRSRIRCFKPRCRSCSRNGGIGGIVERFRQSGYAAQADSWVSTGQNQPIGADALQQVLGSGALRELEAKLGAAPGSAAGALASILPQMIDQMTPQGKIPDEQSDPVAQALAMLNARRAG